MVEFVTIKVTKTPREGVVSLEDGPDLVVDSINGVTCQLYKHGGGKV